MDSKFMERVPLRTSPNHFLEIPVEMRCKIIEFALEGTQLIVNQHGDSSSKCVIAQIKDCPAIRFVCRQLNDEARPLVAKSLTLVVRTLFFAASQMPASMRSLYLSEIRMLNLHVFKSWDWPMFDPRCLPALEVLVVREYRMSYQYPYRISGEVEVNACLDGSYDQHILQDLISNRNAWSVRQKKWIRKYVDDRVPNMCIIGADPQRRFRIVLDSCSYVVFNWGGSQTGKVYISWVVDLDSAEILERKALLDRRGHRTVTGIDWRTMFAAHDDGDIVEEHSSYVESDQTKRLREAAFLRDRQLQYGYLL